MERKGQVTFKGGPVTLVGPELKVGEMAPDFTAINTDMQPVKLSDYRGQTVILSIVPSLDTGVCADQTRRFNQEAKALDAKIVTVSLDLPFAQKRFCTDNKVEDLLTVSDYKDHEFADKYGLLLKELGLLARAVMVIDKDGKIVYQEIVPEIAQAPNFEAALEAVRNAG